MTLRLSLAALLLAGRRALTDWTPGWLATLGAAGLCYLVCLAGILAVNRLLGRMIYPHLD